MQDASESNYVVRILEYQALDQLLQLQEAAMQGLTIQDTGKRFEPNVDSYVPLSKEEFQVILEGKGLVIGCFADETLIAFHSLFYPGDHPDNLGYDFGMDAMQRLQVGHLEAACVHPLHRGHGIQTDLTRWLLRFTREQGNYRYLFETVAPTNLASVKSTLKSGLTLQRYQLKYGGKKRFLFGIDLHKPFTYDVKQSSLIAVSDAMEVFEQVFAQGYHGIELVKQDDHAYVRFAKAFA